MHLLKIVHQMISNWRCLRRNELWKHKQIFIFCTFIEKVHLKKYTDILPFTDCRYRCSKRVHSILLFYDASCPWYHKHSSLVDISLERGGMGARPATYSVNRKTNCSIINFFLSSVHYCIREPQNYVASLTNENRLKMKKIIT